MQNQIVCWLLALMTMILTFGFSIREVQAKVYSPWIVSEHVADTSSLEAFRQFPEWKDKSGQDLALAVWKYFVGTETGVFHYRPISLTPYHPITLPPYRPNPLSPYHPNTLTP